MRLLAIDCGSVLASVAVGDHTGVRAVRSFGVRQAAERLVAAIDQALGEAGMAVGELDGVAALRGPGSFTGLRIALATALGLHQGLGCPAIGVDTLEVLAAAGAAVGPGAQCGFPRWLTAAVAAHDDQWFVQSFVCGATTRPAPTAEPRRWPFPLLLAHAREHQTVAQAGPSELGAHDPGALAPHLLRLLPRVPLPWPAATLVEPAYLRGALVTIDGRREEHG